MAGCPSEKAVHIADINLVCISFRCCKSFCEFIKFSPAIYCLHEIGNMRWNLPMRSCEICGVVLTLNTHVPSLLPVSRLLHVELSPKPCSLLAFHESLCWIP